MTISYTRPAQYKTEFEISPYELKCLVCILLSTRNKTHREVLRFLTSIKTIRDGFSSFEMTKSKTRSAQSKAGWRRYRFQGVSFLVAVTKSLRKGWSLHIVSFRNRRKSGVTATALQSIQSGVDVGTV